MMILTIDREVYGMDRSICPLCGQPNDCYMENGKDPRNCWCKDVTFPEGLLLLVPEEARRQACICRSCAEKYREKGAAFLTEASR